MRRNASVGPRRVVAVTLAGVLMGVSHAPVEAQRKVQHLRGQNVAPVYDGYEANPDGTYSLWFGYLNRNHEEAIDVPIGPDNRFEPGEAGPVPREVRQPAAGDEAERLSRTGRPLGHRCAPGDLLDDSRTGRLLEDHQVGIAGANHAQQCILAAASAVPDVVAEHPERHGSARFSMSVR